LIGIDSYGWVGRFTNGPKAQPYNRIIEKVRPDEIITSVIVLYDVYRKVKQVKGEEVALETVAALSQTRIVPIDQTLSLEAADYSLAHGLHFAHALIYATSRHFDAELYTSDQDLKGLNHVSFV
jgi:predicted nucleic acid-binding protein